MENRVISLIQPHQDHNLVKVHLSNIPLTKDMTIYETVDFFEKNIFPNIRLINEKIKEQIELKNIVNFHNIDGIKDKHQIISMVKQIKLGEPVLSQSGLPNVKLVKTNKNELILFDGHHSMLAYMLAGKKHLNQIPHLIVNDGNGHVQDNEILVFFGEHSKKIKDSEWRNFVINWQAPKEKQLCKRIQRNMDELLKPITAYLQLSPFQQNILFS